MPELNAFSQSGPSAGLELDSAGQAADCRGAKARRETRPGNDIDHSLRSPDTKPPTQKARGSSQKSVFDPAFASEIIEMALSDHVKFSDIRTVHGLGPDQVKALMRRHLAPASYRAWRRRVRHFSDQRTSYK